MGDRKVERKDRIVQKERSGYKPAVADSVGFDHTNRFDPTISYDRFCCGAVSYAGNQELCEFYTYDQDRYGQPVCEDKTLQVSSNPPVSTKTPPILMNNTGGNVAVTLSSDENGISDHYGDLKASIDLDIGVSIEGWLFPGNDNGIRQKLEELVLLNGMRNTQNFVERIRESIREDIKNNQIMRQQVEKFRGDVSGYPLSDIELENTIMVKRRIPVIFGEIKRSENIFIEGAKQVAVDLLNLSEQRLKAEQVKYGIKEHKTERKSYDENRVESKVEFEDYTMDNNQQTQALMSAAQRIYPYKQRVDFLKDQKNRIINEQSRIVASSQTAYSREAFYFEIASVDRAISQAKDAYEKQVSKKLDRFPILAEGLKEDGTDIITPLASGKLDWSADVLGRDLKEKFANIVKVREDIKSGKINIWKLPILVNKTVEFMKLPPESFEAKYVQMMVDQTASKEFWIKITLALLGIGLAILTAIPSAGASMAGLAKVAGAGLSIYSVYDSYQEYNFQSKISNTDYNEAYLMSREHPDLFWLALDIVGALVDLGQAVKGAREIFQSLATQRKLVGSLQKTARTSKEAREELRKLVVEGNEVKPGLGDRLALDAMSEGEKAIAAGSRTERTIAKTLSYDEMKERFFKYFQVEGPKPGKYIICQTDDDFKAFYHSANYVKPGSPVPAGFYDQWDDVIILPPKANAHTVIHECLHEAGTVTIRKNYGTFLDEGITEWFTRKALGARDEVHAYDLHVDFINMLVGKIGEEPLRQLLFNKNTAMFEKAIETIVGSEMDRRELILLLKKLNTTADKLNKLSIFDNINNRLFHGMDTSKLFDKAVMSKSFLKDSEVAEDAVAATGKAMKTSGKQVVRKSMASGKEVSRLSKVNLAGITLEQIDYLKIRWLEYVKDPARRLRTEEDYIRYIYGITTGQLEKGGAGMPTETLLAIEGGRIAEKVWSEALIYTYKNNKHYVVDFYDPIRKQQLKVDVIPDFIPSSTLDSKGMSVTAKNMKEALLIADSKYNWDLGNKVRLTDQVRAMLTLAKQNDIPFVFLVREGGMVSQGIEDFAKAIGVEYKVMRDTKGIIK